MSGISSLVAAFLAVVAAPAGEAAPPLTMSELLAAVDEANPAASAADARVEAARARVSPAGAWEDPFVAVGPDEIALGMVDDGMGGEPMYPMPVVRFQASQTIPLPGKLAPRRDAAEALVDASAQDATTLRRALRVSAIQTFLRGVYVHRQIEANVKTRALLDEIAASQEARYRTGGAAHHEVLLAKVEQTLLDRDRLILQRELRILHVRLNELMGRDTDAPIGLLVDDRAEGAAPATLEDALGAQPELSSLRALQTSAEARERGAERAWWPDLVVQGMAMASFMPEEPSNVGAMIGVSVPIFAPWKQSETARAAVRERIAVELDRTALVLRVRAEWTDANNALATARDAVRLYEESVLPATAAALESSRAAYASSRMPMADLLAVVRAQVAAELEAEAARIDVRLAEARIANLLSTPDVLQLTPTTPTLFSGGGMGGANGAGMGRSMGMRGGPVRMGPGMKPPTTLQTPDEGTSGGMGGM